MLKNIFKTLILFIIIISFSSLASTKKCYITFSSKGGNGKAEKFWIYTKGSSDTDVNQDELYNYNDEKYPEDYEEYFDPQYPDDSDKYCNPAPRKDLELGYYGKKPQSWFVEFDTLFK